MRTAGEAPTAMAIFVMSQTKTAKATGPSDLQAEKRSESRINLINNYENAVVHSNMLAFHSITVLIPSF
jgi:hypothetical protein